MYSIPTTIPSSANTTFDENQWISQIRKTLEEELEEDSNIPISVFNVPKILMASDPDSYIPQQISLGPYHFFRPELYEMEKCKLDAAKRVQNDLESRQFEQLVEKLIKNEPKIRACYQRYLTFNGKTLAWMMAIDVCFVLEFLHRYIVKADRGSSKMSHLVDATGRKSPHNAILRDMMMLENQIPLFILRKMLKIRETPDLADKMLISMLVGLCRELSPIKILTENLTNIQIKNRAHILDFMYHMIVPQLEEPPAIIKIEEQNNGAGGGGGGGGGGEGGGEKKTFKESTHVKQFLNVIYKVFLKLNHGPVRLLKRLLSKPIKLIVRLPWSILSNLPVIRILKQPIEALFSSIVQDKDEEKSENENNHCKAPLVEEISIPSVTQLYKSGVCFVPIKGGIMDVSFNNKTITLSLPIVSLDVNSEVILRNLVAYEACCASRPLIFTRYTELMCGIIDTEEDAKFLSDKGIIDTEEDAKFLSDKGIIVNRLKSGEVANLWNGMSKSVKLTKLEYLDTVIEDVNRYYNGRWKVKAKKFMNEYVFSSWQFLTLLATTAMLCLMTLQAFCSVYRCARLFHIEGIM